MDATTKREDFILRALCNLLDALDDEAEDQWRLALDEHGTPPERDRVLFMLLEVARDRRGSGAVEDAPLEKLLRTRVERAHPERRRYVKPTLRELVDGLRHAVAFALGKLVKVRPLGSPKRMAAVHSAEFTIGAAAARLDLNFRLLLERERKGRARASDPPAVRSKNCWDEVRQLLLVSDPSVDEVVKLVLRQAGFSAKEASDSMRPSRVKD
jgi:hypothetical protein